MKGLLDFLYKHNHWLLFLLLESISLVLLFSLNDFQGNIWMSSANAVSGRLFETRQKISTYFGLREENERLAEQNARLEEQLFALTQSIDSLQLAEIKRKFDATLPFDIIAASVVENSINRLDNYITINRGSDDGIQPNMGVISSSGVVGITYKCSRHYTLVIPILNKSKSSISCMVIPENSPGSLVWEGGDPRTAKLQSVQRYANIHVGDTVITSGHSGLFPKNLNVGIIEELEPSADNLLYDITVKLDTEFSNLSHVFVIQNHNTAERRELEQSPEKKTK